VIPVRVVVRVLASSRAGAAAWLLTCGLACGLESASAKEPPFEAVVSHVSDGDTVWVRTDPAPEAPKGRRIKLRLLGLDAPERCQPRGPEATAALMARVQDRRVTVRREATDDHGRGLATLWIDGVDVGAQLVADGHAWSARYRGNPGPYANEEAEARRVQRGLFADLAPELPRDFRKRHGPCP
jgi:endonuclease YncB( thermonuclease family)